MKRWAIVPLLLVCLLTGCRKEAKGMTPFKDSNGLMGYKDSCGNVKIKPVYVFAETFSKHGIAAVGDPSKGWIYIDTQGRFIIKPYPFDNGYDEFSEGLARFEVKGKIGYFNRAGKVAIPAQFEFAQPFKNGFAAVAKDVTYKKDEEHTSVIGKWGFINNKGELAIPYQYDSAFDFDKNEMAEVVFQGQRVWIDTAGNVVEVMKNRE